MPVTVELLAEIDAGLATLAAEQGLSLNEYVRRLLEERVPRHGQSKLSPAKRAAASRESVRGPPHTPPLSDAAISRLSTYAARG
jgi:hypothetical protein